MNIYCDGKKKKEKGRRIEWEGRRYDRLISERVSRERSFDENECRLETR